MRESPLRSNKTKKKTKSLSIILFIAFITSLALFAYSAFQPTMVTNQVDENQSMIKTEYNYQATVEPNILHPDGGTVDVGDTIFKNITTEIPIHLNTIIESNQAVKVEGTHQVHVVIKAGDLWEKEFPLEQEQSILQEGTDLNLIDNTYTADLNQIKSFITGVEKELGVRPDLYTVEVVPHLQGTVTSNGMERDILVMDKLSFQYSYDDMRLASNKEYNNTVSFTSVVTVANTVSLFGLQLSVKIVRIISALISLLLFIAFMFAYKNRPTQYPTVASSIEKINKRYGNRMITVKDRIDKRQEFILTLDSIQSLIKVADEKELPIFTHKDQYDKDAVYFIIDGDYLYCYEIGKNDVITSINKRIGSDQSYAEG